MGEINKQKIIDIIKEITVIDGTPGDEKKVRDYIIKEIKNHVDSYEVDNLGNLIVHKKGKNKAKNKVMLSAHMDEVGFIISGIEDNGLLNFIPLGGVDTRAALGERIRVGDKGNMGVIGVGAVHLAKDKNIPDMDDLKLDMGFISKKEAEKHVKIGDRAHFDSDIVEFGDDRIKVKALDDRAGCAILMDIIMQDEIDYDLFVVFGTQEEVGLRGARAYSYNVNPDYAIVVETTTAADISGVKGVKKACKQGEGAVIPFADGSAIYNRELLDLAFFTAKEIGAKAQNKTMVAGGTDAGVIHQSMGGILTTTISMPCRYLHTSSSMLKKSDIYDTRRVVEAYAYKLATR